MTDDVPKTALPPSTDSPPETDRTSSPQAGTQGKVHPGDDLCEIVAGSDAGSSTPRIGRYPVLKFLGEGSFGRVYLAHDERLDKPVAIKVAKQLLVGDQPSTGAYLAEARILARLEHPHIIPVYDVRSDEELPYIVMKYVDGVTFNKWIERDRPGIQTIVETLTAVADALNFAHRNNLVHRDLKPSNILIDQDGKPLITDFGLALPIDDRRAWQGIVTGTLPYMSPEQVRGEAHRIDGRSDIWSFGVILYEQLVGSRPFTGIDSEQMRADISTVDPPPPRMRKPSIPHELERICLKCLEKRRSDRYSTAFDLVEDFKHWLDSSQNAPPTPKAKETPVSAPTARFVPKGLRAFTGSDASYFLDLLPGPRDRSGLPESVRSWKTRIEELDPEQTFSVGLIYGPSGCGKSSLVLAGVIPGLDPEFHAIHVEATPEETELRLARALRKMLPGCPPDESLPTLFAGLRKAGAKPPTSQISSQTDRRVSTIGLLAKPVKKVVLFIDQFEQWLHSHPEIPEGELVQALRQCDGGALQAVLMVRDDFAMAAARFMHALDVPIQQGKNFATVDLFDLTHAETILKRFGHAYGKLPADPDQFSAAQREFVSSAAAGLAQAGSVVPVRLALFAEMVKSKPWVPETLDAVGGTTGVGVNFLEETFCSRSANPRYRLHEQGARRVLRALLPELGSDIKSRMRQIDSLREAAGYEQRSDEFDDLIRILDSELRLITPTDPEGESRLGSDAGRRAGESARTPAPTPVPAASSYYQLTHDYLVPSLRTWLSRGQRETVRGRAELRLGERESLWSVKPEHRQLPSALEFLTIAAVVPRRDWTQAQAQMMRAATNYYATRFVSAAVLLLVVGYGVFDLVGRTRAQSFVNSLKTASEDDVNALVEQIGPYRRWALPELRNLAFSPLKAGDDERPQLNARLALVVTDESWIDELVESMLAGDPRYIGCIRTALRHHRTKLVENLWRVFHDDNSASDRRLRAGIALSDYDAASPMWTDSDYRFLTEQLVNYDPESQPRIRELLSGIRTELIPSLEDLFRRADAAERPLAGSAYALAEFARTNPDQIQDLICDSTPDQFAILAPLLDDFDQSDLVSYLANTAAREPDENTSSEDRIRLGRRRANAAIVLLRLRKPMQALCALGGIDDPESVSQFAHGCRQRGVRPVDLLECLEVVESTPLSKIVGTKNGANGKTSHSTHSLLDGPEARRLRDRIKFGILLTLGEYNFGDIPESQREPLRFELEKWFDDDKSSAIHGVTGWLLRRWGFDEIVDDLESREVPYDPSREWFRLSLQPGEDSENPGDSGDPPQPRTDVRRFSTLTFVVFPAGRYVVGAPEDEREQPREARTTVELTRPFAVLQHELTYGHLIASGLVKEPEKEEDQLKMEDKRRAYSGPNWYDAVKLCRRLSKRYSFDEAEQAYPDPEKCDEKLYPRSKFEEAGGAPENWPLNLDRPGFRLPLEAEWEIACRGGARTAYGCGGDRSLLAKYGWFIENIGNADNARAYQPPGLLRPNCRGLFDMHGNVSEWCHDVYYDGKPIQSEAIEAPARVSYRVTRGGNTLDRWMPCRSAYRNRFPPINRSRNTGFRLAVTLPAEPVK